MIQASIELVLMISLLPSVGSTVGMDAGGSSGAFSPEMEAQVVLDSPVAPPAQPPESSTLAEGEIAPVETGKRTLTIFPRGDYYPPNVADPFRRTNTVTLMSVNDVGIADSGRTRFGLKLGGRFGLLRSSPRANPDRGWQLNLEVGFYGQFDGEHSQDNIGWDGYYGLILTGAVSSRLAWKVGTMHTSAHVGDEYAERTGRSRIGYTRQELQAGVSWHLTETWRTYLELGWGVDLRNEDLQQPGRLEWGLVFESPESLWRGRLGWYVATDVQAWEERDWDVGVALQAGIMTRTGFRTWRIGLEYYDGRSPMGEFFQDDETAVAFGIWLDL